MEEKKTLHKGKYLQFVERGGWEYIERLNCEGAVVIVALTDKNKLLFVEQYRPPVDKRVIEFPAGLVDDLNQKAGRKNSESYETAAKRELLEETGYQASRIEKIIVGPTSSGSSSSILTMVRAYGLKKIHQGGGDASESIKVHEVPLADVDVWLKKQEHRGCYVGPRIYAGLYYINKYNKHENQ